VLELVVNLGTYLVEAVLAPFVRPLKRVRHVVYAEPGLALLLLLGLLICAVRAVRGDRWSAVLLVPLSFSWALFNGPLEGATLFAVSQSHGVTVSDLISLAGLMIAAWRLAPAVVRR
jgi:hypothetical protein